MKILQIFLTFVIFCLGCGFANGARMGLQHQSTDTYPALENNYLRRLQQSIQSTYDIIYILYAKGWTPFDQEVVISKLNAFVSAKCEQSPVLSCDQFPEYAKIPLTSSDLISLLQNQGEIRLTSFLIDVRDGVVTADTYGIVSKLARCQKVFTEDNIRQVFQQKVGNDILAFG